MKVTENDKGRIYESSASSPEESEKEKAAMRAEWIRENPTRPFVRCEHVVSGVGSLMLVGMSAMGLLEMCDECTSELCMATAEYAKRLMLKMPGWNMPAEVVAQLGKSEFLALVPGPAMMKVVECARIVARDDVSMTVGVLMLGSALIARSTNMTREVFLRMAAHAWDGHHIKNGGGN